MKNIGVVFNNENNMDLFGIDVVHVVLLTHVDTLDLITKGDLIDVYKCVPSRRGLTPRGSLECNPEIPASPGEEN